MPVNELSSLLDKLKVPGSYIAKGYTADEHAGLFTELNNVQRSRAQIPIILTRIAHPNKSTSGNSEGFLSNSFISPMWLKRVLPPKACLDTDGGVRAELTHFNQSNRKQTIWEHPALPLRKCQLEKRKTGSVVTIWAAMQPIGSHEPRVYGYAH